MPNNPRTEIPSNSHSVKRVTAGKLQATWYMKKRYFMVEAPVGITEASMTLKGVDGVYSVEFDTFSSQGSFVKWEEFDYAYNSSEYLLEREYYRTYRKRPSTSDFPFPRTRSLSKFYNPARPSNLVNGSSLFRRRPLSPSEFRIIRPQAMTSYGVALPTQTTRNPPKNSTAIRSRSRSPLTPRRASSPSPSDCSGAAGNSERSSTFSPSSPTYDPVPITSSPLSPSSNDISPPIPTSSIIPVGPKGEGMGMQREETPDTPETPETPVTRRKRKTPLYTPTPRKPLPSVLPKKLGLPLNGIKESMTPQEKGNPPENDLAVDSNGNTVTTMSEDADLVVTEAITKLPESGKKITLPSGDAIKHTTQGYVSIRDPTQNLDDAHLENAKVTFSCPSDSESDKE